MRTRIIWKKTLCYMRDQLAGGVLPKIQKYFEVMINKQRKNLCWSIIKSFHQNLTLALFLKQS